MNIKQKEYKIWTKEDSTITEEIVIFKGEVVLTVDLEKCIRQNVQAARKTVKSHSSQLKAGTFSVKTALEIEENKLSRFVINGIWCIIKFQHF